MAHAEKMFNWVKLENLRQSIKFTYYSIWLLKTFLYMDNILKSHDISVNIWAWKHSFIVFFSEILNIIQLLIQPKLLGQHQKRHLLQKTTVYIIISQISCKSFIGINCRKVEIWSFSQSSYYRRSACTVKMYLDAQLLRYIF